MAKHIVQGVRHELQAILELQITFQAQSNREQTVFGLVAVGECEVFDREFFDCFVFDLWEENWRVESPYPSVGLFR